MNASRPILPPYPRATVRLQLSADFTFADAAAEVPTLAALGFSHLYASPVLAARAGSTHGYDIVDHNRLNPEFGGQGEFDDLVSVLHDHGMGLILDFVPNHMGVGFSDNTWWQNVLEWGQNSPFARFFDIDWSPAEQSLRGTVLVPVLGRQYGACLEAGELKLSFEAENGAFAIRYYDHRLPVSPRHYGEILSAATDALSDRKDTSGDLEHLAGEFTDLRPSRSATRQAMVIRRSEELRSRLSELVRESPELRIAIETATERWNGSPGEPRSFDRLHRLLERQAYRLAYWRLAANEINYRRFFDINDLAAIRMEEPAVFDLTHQLLLRLVGDGAVQGLRLDHQRPDRR